VDQSAVSVRSRSEILTDALLQHGGITVASVLIGLVLYSLTILVRNIIEGLRGIPDDVLEAARGMGYGARRLLFTVELPLAMPLIRTFWV
jgi:osmoprotectant transport system permease protein